MCKTPPSDEGGPRLTVTNGVDLETREEWGGLWHTVDCITCGASVTNEYLEEAVRLWNGEPPPKDDEEGEDE